MRSMAAATDKKLFSHALALSPAKRARLARELLASLDGPADPGAAKAWLAEIERRAREVDDGTARTVEWKSFRARLERRWGRR